jgi:hypothetical protein
MAVALIGRRRMLARFVAKGLASMLAVLFCASVSMVHAQTADKRLMTDAEYKNFLTEVDSALPKWEAALKSIEPENDSRISYAVGKMIVQNRDVGLIEIDNIRTYVAKLRKRRTVSGEVALYGFMQSLYDSMGAEVDTEAIANVTLSHIETFAPEMSTLGVRIGSDSMARLELLEKETCP